jgi:hypothetical protein
MLTCEEAQTLVAALGPHPFTPSSVFVQKRLITAVSRNCFVTFVISSPYSVERYSMRSTVLCCADAQALEMMPDLSRPTLTA